MDTVPLRQLDRTELGDPPYKALLAPNGLILLTGRSGAGKATRIASIVQEYIVQSTEKLNIALIDDFLYDLSDQSKSTIHSFPLSGGSQPIRVIQDLRRPSIGAARLRKPYMQLLSLIRT